MNNNITNNLETDKSEIAGNTYDHYIAIDWSINLIVIARLTKTKTTPVIIEHPPDIKDLIAYLKNLKGSKILTIEESTTSHWLYVNLYEYVDRIIICDPVRNRLLSEGPKNDKIDAKKLCALLRNNMLKEVYHADNSLYQLRKLVSHYTDIVKASVRAQNQRSALYRSENKRPNSGEQLENNLNNRIIITNLDNIILEYENQINILKQQFEEYSNNLKIIRDLQSIPGIGLIGSCKIVALTVDPKRFENTGKYLAYCGLVKYSKESGNKKYGQKNPRYCRALKAVYKTAAITVLKKSNSVKDYYDYLVTQKNLDPSKARNQIARYIAKVSIGLMKSSKRYKPYLWRENIKMNNSA